MGVCCLEPYQLIAGLSLWACLEVHCNPPHLGMTPPGRLPPACIFTFSSSLNLYVRAGRAMQTPRIRPSRSLH